MPNGNLHLEAGAKTLAPRPILNGRKRKRTWILRLGSARLEPTLYRWMRPGRTEN